MKYKDNSHIIERVYFNQKGSDMGGISIWQLLIIALIVILLFGSKKLRGLGSDLGDAVKGFKNSVNDDKSDADFSPEQLQEQQKQNTEATEKTQQKD